MKKILNLVLVVVLILSLGACNKDDVQSEISSDVSTGEFVPTKNITYVVPYDAGGVADVSARVLTSYMSQYSDVEIEVTNIVGANGITGAQNVYESEANYNIIHQPVAYPMNAGLGVMSLTYEDFEPIALWMDSSMGVAVHADAPWNSMEELMADVVANPGEIRGGAATATLPVFAYIYLGEQHDGEFNIVDLATSQKAPELLSGRIDVYIDSFSALRPFVESGEFKVLGIISDKEVAGYEDIPTFKEIGYEGYEFLKQAHGCWAAPGSSPEAVEYLNDLIRQSLENPECVEQLKNLGYDTWYMSVEDYNSHLETAYSEFAEIARNLAG